MSNYEHYLLRRDGKFFIKRLSANGKVKTNIIEITVSSGTGWCTEYRNTSYSKYTLTDNSIYCVTGGPGMSNTNAYAEMVYVGDPIQASCDMVLNGGELIASGTVPLCVETYDPPVVTSGRLAYLKVYNGKLTEPFIGNIVTLNMTSGTNRMTGIPYEIVDIQTNNSPLPGAQDKMYYLTCATGIWWETGCRPHGCCQGFYYRGGIEQGLCTCENFNLLDPAITGDNIWITESRPPGGFPAPLNPTPPTYELLSSGLKINYDYNGFGFNEGIWKTNRKINLYGSSIVLRSGCFIDDCTATGLRITVHRSGGDNDDDAFAYAGVMSKTGYWNDIDNTKINGGSDPIPVGGTVTFAVPLCPTPKDGYVYLQGTVGPASSTASSFIFTNVSVIVKSGNC